MEAEARSLQVVSPVARAVTTAFDYMPKNLGELIEFANVMAKSTMVPKDYVDKPGNIIVAVQFGAELGLKPFQAMQSIAVINGKPGIYGDAGKALLLANGCVIVEDDMRLIGQNKYASCTIKRPGRPDVTRTFGEDDAKRAKLAGKSGPWTDYPYRQMAWRAFWFAARDAAADILKGMAGVEELVDHPRDVTGEGETLSTGATTATTRTDALKSRLKKVDVAVVVKAFDEVKTADELAAAVNAAVGLTDEKDRATANEAYHRAKTRIKAADATTPPTWQEVIEKIDAAENEDAFALAADLIRSLPDEAERKSAQAHFDEVHGAFTAGKD